MIYPEDPYNIPVQPTPPSDPNRAKNPRYKENPFDINNPAEASMATDWMNARDKQMLDMAGVSARPEFESARDASGQISDVYRIKPKDLTGAAEGRMGAVQRDDRALNALRDQALSTGDSPWLKLQLQKQGLDEQAARDQAAGQSAGATASAESALAMRGGLGSGARERLARGGAWNALAAQQGIGAQGQQTRLGLQTTAEDQRQNTLRALPGMESSVAGQDLEKARYLNDFSANQQTKDIEAQKYNSSAALNDVLQNRAFDLGKYGEEMKAWAANKTGDAMANSGKK